MNTNSGLRVALIPAFFLFLIGESFLQLSFAAISASCGGLLLYVVYEKFLANIICNIEDRKRFVNFSQTLISSIIFASCLISLFFVTQPTAQKELPQKIVSLLRQEASNFKADKSGYIKLQSKSSLPTDFVKMENILGFQENDGMLIVRAYDVINKALLETLNSCSDKGKDILIVIFIVSFCIFCIVLFAKEVVWPLQDNNKSKSD